MAGSLLFNRRQFTALLGAMFTPALPGVAAVPAPRMAPLVDFAIAGGYYHGLEQALGAGLLTKGAKLTLKPEPENPFDSNAIAVLGPDGVRLGYVPRAINREVLAAMKEGAAIALEICEPLTEDDYDDDTLFHTFFTEGDPRLRLWVEEG